MSTTMLASETLRPARRATTLEEARRSPALWTLGVIIALTAIASLIAPYGGNEITDAGAWQSPSWSHPFGTDGNGMDVLSRVLVGAQTDLVLGLAAAGLAAIAGVLLGCVAGYLGGPADSVLQRLAEVVQSFPVVMLGMAVLVAVGASLVNLALVIAVVNVPVYFRIVRSVVLPMRDAEFVHAARVAGNRDAAIVVRHILPNVWAPVIAQFTVNFAWAIQIIAGLSFLGIGVRVPDAEWGLMIQQGSEALIRGVWWASFFPGIAIFGTVLLLNRVGAWCERTWRIR